MCICLFDYFYLLHQLKEEITNLLKTLCLYQTIKSCAHQRVAFVLVT